MRPHHLARRAQPLQRVTAGALQLAGQLLEVLGLEQPGERAVGHGLQRRDVGPQPVRQPLEQLRGQRRHLAPRRLGAQRGLALDRAGEQRARGLRILRRHVRQQPADRFAAARLGHPGRDGWNRFHVARRHRAAARPARRPGPRDRSAARSRTFRTRSWPGGLARGSPIRRYSPDTCHATDLHRPRPARRRPRARPPAAAACDRRAPAPRARRRGRRRLRGAGARARAGAGRRRARPRDARARRPRRSRARCARTAPDCAILVFSDQDAEQAALAAGRRPLPRQGRGLRGRRAGRGRARRQALSGTSRVNSQPRPGPRTRPASSRRGARASAARPRAPCPCRAGRWRRARRARRRGPGPASVSPRPLSATRISSSDSPASAVITIRGGTPGRRYLIALAITFCSAAASSVRGTWMSGTGRRTSISACARAGRRAQRVDHVVAARPRARTRSPASRPIATCATSISPRT